MVKRLTRGTARVEERQELSSTSNFDDRFLEVQ
jgi:hypothetical protein